MRKTDPVPRQTYYPSISVVIPTLNAGKFLRKCLRSISNQDYPKNKIEIIIADGGSIDNTISVALEYNAKVVQNTHKTAESGKAAGIHAATGDLIALIDSDNILPEKDWFIKMTKPFSDKRIVASEPLFYSSRKKDPYLTRYFASLGMNDPLCLFLGNYDRYSVLTKRWTDLDFPSEEKQDYKLITLNKTPLPTFGANGFVIKRDLVVTKSPYLFDMDILFKLVRRQRKVYVAKVYTSIIHTYVESSLLKFFKKQFRRVNDLSFHSARKNRKFDWVGTYLVKILWFQVACVTFIPLLYQTLVGLYRTRDYAWLVHPLICYSTWIIYVWGWIKGKFIPSESDRTNWKQ